jgi:PKD repeat protein|tara:strand:- start:2861 stop:6085 length:3225 start_codon:yes stop_codon:yes gene_type:complete
MKKYYSFLILVVFVFSSNIYATPITIGTGTTTNTTTSYPAPYGNWYHGAKHQFLILASELSAAGMTAGNINSLAFDVAQAQGTPLQGFTIALKLTSTSTVSAFETGLTTVYGPQTHTDVVGLNNHMFISPFYWDGTSNLLVETCFNNTSWTNNAMIYNSTTSFTSSIWYRADNPNVCTSSLSSVTGTQRPNMVFDWIAANIPPSSNFSASTTYTCSGVVSFTDLSTQNPTSWLWNFGDGNTSTQQNPTHTYVSGGTYTVTLIACNAFGCDTLTMNNLITVNLSGSSPIAASCTPNTLTYCCGFGITQVDFNTISNSSTDGAAGYSDFTCYQTTVFEGASYTLSIGSSAQSTQNYAAWIDFNNDGVFNNTTERVFTATSQMNTSGSVSIPSGAVLNTPLRMRISADYDFSAAPTPCANLDFGQAEDYTVIITQNLNAPIAAFSLSPNPSCSGTTCFTDQSQNVPTSWLWNFGDSNTSTQQNPCHTYAADGVYTVTFIATNTNGSDTITQTVNITTANQVLSASCTPSTLSYCCGYGILDVSFNTISNSSADGSEGYKDFSCSQQTTLNEGSSYVINITTGSSNAQDTRVWIDFNNDGVFNNTNELVLTINNAFNPIGNITIPSGAVLNTPLRMRITSDVVGNVQNACGNSNFGQTEDYGVVIQPNTSPPTANFVASDTNTCSDTIHFTDLSTNIPTGWTWYFGDGNTSTQQNPSHYYTNPGTYTVSLVVTNAFGQDSVAMVNYITIECFNTMPISGSIVITDCNGTLYDDGGASMPYSNNTNGVVTIQPTGAAQITLNFVSFNFESGFDSLFIYDGPTIASPILGGFSGTNLPGIITSTGGSITIRQKSDFTVVRPGFELNWFCSTSSSNNMPVTGNTSYTDCNGTLYDNGGPSLDYSNNTDGTVTIQPAGATQITLTFGTFDFESGFDSLIIYDGPTTASPVLAGLSGNALPAPISSSGGSITIRQKTDFTIVRPGFQLNWTCSTVGIDENLLSTDINVFPNPVSDILHVEVNNFNIDIKELVLVNTVGQVVDIIVPQTNIFIYEFSVAHQPKGIYFMNVISDKGVITKKIIVQ